MSVTDTSTYLAFISKGSADPSLKSPLVVPEVTPVNPDPNRLCSADGACGLGHAGCYRSDILLLIESEFNIIVDGNQDWFIPGAVRCNGSIFYYKPYLENIFSHDLQNIEADLSNATHQANIVKVQSFLGYTDKKDVIGSTSLVDIRAIIDSAPAGMPPFVIETTNFYKFVDICETAITPDNITKELLDQIKATFTDEQYSVYYSNLARGLYKKGDTLYFANLINWKKTPTKKIGIFTNSEQYIEKDSTATSTSYFFPFNTLSEEELDFVNTFDAQDHLNTEITIVNL